MSGQNTAIAVPIVLFEQRGAATVDRGNAACAIVGQAGNQLRYKLVCYNDQRQTLCAATITGSNEHSLQFALQTNEYASFRDDQGMTFNMMFLRSGDIEPFLAHLGIAMFGAAGQPAHTPLLADLAHTLKRSGPQLQISQRAKVKFHAYSFTPGAGGSLPTLGELVETNGDANYAFDALQSSYALLPEGKGFEASVAGMVEDAKRIVVVPAGMPRGVGPRASPSASTVFIVHLVRAVPIDRSVPAAGPPVVMSSALVLAAPPGAAAEAAPPKVMENGSTTAAATEPAPATSGLGGGVPAEHMLLVQRVAAQINTASSTLRDLQDKIAAFGSDWQQTQNRPKPSVLSSQALDHGVKQLIADHEKLRDEIVRRDDLIKALEERNVDLQRRVDKAAQTAQSLMDEKKQTVTQSSDFRLDVDRQVMKLQEQVTRASNERDDLTRHLQTVKKLLDLSDNDLRETKGKAEVLKVQAGAVVNKLDAAEDQLGEERSRRKAHEAKTAALLEEIRSAQAEVQLKSALLEDLRRQADADRTHYAQLMEDERQRRSLETAQLRSEIVTELQSREQKFIADRSRTAEEHFARGRDEGVELGRRDARIDMENKLQELLFETQRAKSELDAYKTQARSLQDDSMAEHRRLDAIVSALKRNTEEATREKASREYQLQASQMKTRSAEDQILLAVTSAVHRLSRPVDASDLLEMVECIRQGKYPDYSFEVIRRNEEREATIGRRIAWMDDEFEKQFARLLIDTHMIELHTPINAAYQVLLTTIRRLWEARDAAAIQRVNSESDDERYAIQREESDLWARFIALVLAQAEERRRLEELELEGRVPIDDEQTEDWRSLLQLVVAQAAERQEVELFEQSDREVVALEAIDWFATFERWLDDLHVERRAVELEEEAARCTILEESWQEWVAEWNAFQRVLYAREIAQREELEEDETAARSVVELSHEVDERAALERDERQERDDAAARAEVRIERERIEEEQLQQRLKDEAEQREAAEASEGDGRTAIVAEQIEENSAIDEAERQERPRAPTPLKPEPVVSVMPVATVSRSAADTDGETTKAVPSPSGPSPPKAAAADPLGGLPGGVHISEATDSDSDQERPPVRRPPPAAPAKAPSKTPGAKAPKLFESSDESDKEAKVAPPRPAAPAARKQPPPRAALFDDDDD